MELSKSEEELMNIIWEKQPVFIKDLLEEYPDPKPALTTVATLLKRMNEKGFISYETIGRSRKYYALVEKKDYFARHVRGLIKNFFGNSASQFASFFTKDTKLTKEELEELRKLIEDEIKKK